MQYRTHRGEKLPEIGIGCYSLSGVYGKKDPEHFVNLVRWAYDLGVTFFDTADIYDPGEEILSRAATSLLYRITSMRDLQRGMLATLPLVPGVVAFGLLYGVMARQVGFNPWEAWAMSAIVHAGSAQFTVLGMWGAVGAFPIILTTLVINLRHLLMGASVAPYLRGLSPLWKALLALWMSDESYALAIAEYGCGHGSHFYFLGANVGIYLAWTSSGLLGALLGAAIPDPNHYGLNLIFPLAFLGLLTAFLKDRVGVGVALTAAGLALLGASALPGKWYIIVAGLLGSAFGLVLERTFAKG